ncbi:Uncharacterised protein [Serratia plymuthica]|nr:Uncharacterised protein [Serratia plymuthica]
MTFWCQYAKVISIIYCTILTYGFNMVKFIFFTTSNFFPVRNERRITFLQERLVS